MKTEHIVPVVVVVILVGIVGGYFFPLSVPQVTVQGSNAVGTTFNTAKVAAINIAPATAAATSSSILNTDTTDRIIMDSFAACTGFGTSNTAYTGTGLASLLIRMATTSTSAPANLTNTNYAANLTIATTTAVGYTASSTEGILTGYSRIWPTGTYLTIQPNATNTAACTVGVHYLGT